MEVIKFVAFSVSEESFLTSSATMANPLPASPARAASMAAFRANKFVWLAIVWTALAAPSISEVN